MGRKSFYIFSTAICLYLLFCTNVFAQKSSFSYRIPSQSINAIVEDNDGFIWLGTKHGLSRYSGSNYTTFFSSADIYDLSNDNISDLWYDSANDVLWIADECGLESLREGKFHHNHNTTQNLVTRVIGVDTGIIVATGRDGIVAFDSEGKYIDRFFEPGTEWISNIAISSTHEIWCTFLFDEQIHLIVLDKDLRVLKREVIPDANSVDCLTANIDNSIWIATDKGLVSYDSISRIRVNLPPEVQALTDGRRLHFITPYRQNSVLVGVKDGGMYSYNFHRKTLEAVQPEKKLTEEFYVCMVDSNNNIWLSDGVSDISFYPQSESFRHINPTGLELSTYHQMTFDRDGYLWFNTKNYYCSYDLRTEKVLWREPEPNQHTFSLIDSRNCLWLIKDHNKIYHYSIRDGIPTLLHSRAFSSSISSICEDNYGNIWVIQNFGISYITPGNRDSFQFTDIDYQDAIQERHTTAQKDPGSGRVFIYTLSGTVYECTTEGLRTMDTAEIKGLSYILTAKDGTVWLGTYNSGLVHYDPNTSKIERFDKTNGLIDGNIKSILEDSEGNIWFSTPMHITKFDIARQKFYTLHDNAFTDKFVYEISSACQTKDGTMYFGGMGGLTVINSGMKFNDEENNIPLHIEYINIEGKQHIEIPDELVLTHKQKHFDFLYSGLNFQSGSLLNYAYMLDGYERDWKYTTELNAIYNNVPPGHYTFRLKVRMMNGDWSDKELSLPVRVKPSVWNSKASILLYIILFLAAVFGGMYLIVKWQMQKELLELSKKREEVARSHIDFISNISHEIRTPLSLIYAPLKQLLKSNSLDEHDRGLLTVMERNANRLNDLSSKLLKPNPDDIATETLKVASLNLTTLCREVCENVRYAARERKLHFETKYPEDLQGSADREKVERVLYNLLTNAIKYTPEGGNISLSMEAAGDNVIFRVEDDGIGIPEDKRESLFNRYERLNMEKKNPRINGTGIGLNYSLALARLHKGDLKYLPADGGGSVFVFTFPYTPECYSEQETASQEDFIPVQIPHIEPVADTDRKDLPILAIIEDNADVRAFLRDLLTPYFNVATANDGDSGLSCIRSIKPDLVISDVVMPGIDGIELCDRVKSDDILCHIPFVLLTAKSDVKSSIEGLKAGADAYIGKPFDPEYLVATVNSLLKNRRMYQKQVLNLTSSTIDSVESGEGDSQKLSQQDRKFLTKLQEIIDSHLGDGGLSVEDLADEMDISYSSLYAKVKSLTGHSPLTYLNTYRMNVADELLRTGNYSVAEVADMVGSSSPFNFTRLFKKHFNVTPSSVKDGTAGNTH